MHEYRRFVEREMNARGWNSSDVARAGDLNRQVVHSIIKDTRERIPQVPDDRTVTGLAKAFSVSVEVVLAHVALAMGLPVSIERADVSAVSDDELIHEIARRLKAGEQGERDTSPMNQAGVRPADEIKARRQLVDEWSFGHPPRGDYGLIADRGPSEGKRQADEAEKRGEESQDPDDEP